MLWALQISQGSSVSPAESRPQARLRPVSGTFLFPLRALVCNCSVM